MSSHRSTWFHHTSHSRTNQTSVVSVLPCVQILTLDMPDFGHISSFVPVEAYIWKRTGSTGRFVSGLEAEMLKHRAIFLRDTGANSHLQQNHSAARRGESWPMESGVFVFFSAGWVGSAGTV